MELEMGDTLKDERLRTEVVGYVLICTNVTRVN